MHGQEKKNSATNAGISILFCGKRTPAARTSLALEIVPSRAVRESLPRCLLGYLAVMGTARQKLALDQIPHER